MSHINRIKKKNIYRPYNYSDFFVNTGYDCFKFFLIPFIGLAIFIALSNPLTLSIAGIIVFTVIVAPFLTSALFSSLITLFKFISDENRIFFHRSDSNIEMSNVINESYVETMEKLKNENEHDHKHEEIVIIQNNQDSFNETFFGKAFEKLRNGFVNFFSRPKQNNSINDNFVIEYSNNNK